MGGNESHYPQPATIITSKQIAVTLSPLNPDKQNHKWIRCILLPLSGFDYTDTLNQFVFSLHQDEFTIIPIDTPESIPLAIDKDLSVGISTGVIINLLKQSFGNHYFSVISTEMKFNLNEAQITYEEKQITLPALLSTVGAHGKSRKYQGTISYFLPNMLVHPVEGKIIANIAIKYLNFAEIYRESRR